VKEISTFISWKGCLSHIQGVILQPLVTTCCISLKLPSQTGYTCIVQSWTTFGAIGYVVSGFLLDKSNDAVVKPSTSVHDWYVKEHTDDSHYFVRYLASAIQMQL
jgi:hypothetical protein